MNELSVLNTWRK